MRTKITWILLIASWLILGIGFYLYWPPRPAGKIYSIQPAQDHSALILQNRHEKQDENSLILYRLNAQNKILWQQEIEGFLPDSLEKGEFISSDGQSAFLSLPIPLEPERQYSRGYKTYSFDFQNGKLIWESPPLQSDSTHNQFWVRNLEKAPLVLTGDSTLITLHKFFLPLEPRNIRGNEQAQLICRSWDKETGAEKWRQTSFIANSPPEGALSKGKLRWQHELTNSLKEVFLFEDSQLLVLKGLFNVSILDLSTGECIWSEDARGGWIGETGCYFFGLQTPNLYGCLTGDDEIRVPEYGFFCFDFQTRKEQQLITPPTYTAINSVYHPLSNIGQGTYQGQTLYFQFYSNWFRGVSFSHIWAQHPTLDTLDWQINLKNALYHYRPNWAGIIPASNHNSPFSGELDRFIPFYGISSLGHQSSDFDVFLLLDLAERTITRTDKFEWVPRPFKPAVVPTSFKKEGMFYLTDHWSYIGLVNPQTGQLEKAISSPSIRDLPFTPHHIHEGLIWTHIRNEVILLDAASLEVKFGSKPSFQDYSHELADSLGLAESRIQ